jgi:hypothetical protein
VPLKPSISESEAVMEDLKRVFSFSPKVFTREECFRFLREVIFEELNKFLGLAQKARVLEKVLSTRSDTYSGVRFKL